MNIIKRNGQEMPFDQNKIRNAISKANNSVDAGVRHLTEKEIDDITSEVTAKCKKISRAVGVEEIQDFVEMAIMAKGAFEVAKNYITYRYRRQLARQFNSTDKKIFAIIDGENEEVKQENSNKAYYRKC